MQSKNTSPVIGGSIGNDNVVVNRILSSVEKDQSTQIRSCGNTTVQNSIIISDYYIAGSNYIFEGMDGGFDIYSNQGIKNESCIVFGVGENSQRCKDTMTDFNQCEVVWDARYD